MTRNMIGCLGPVHKYPYACENVEFSIGSGLAYRPDVEDVFGHQKHRFFSEMVPRVEIGPALRSTRVGGRKRRVSNTMSLRYATVFLSFQRFHLESDSKLLRSKTATSGRVFFCFFFCFGKGGGRKRCQDI